MPGSESREDDPSEELEDEFDDDPLEYADGYGEYMEEAEMPIDELP